MKKLVCILTLATLTINCTTRNQRFSTETSTIEIFNLSPESAHPNARKLLIEEFYWSPIDESGPFGSDDGSDSFYGFVEWRTKNKNISPVVYLNDLIQEWGYTKFDLQMTDPVKIKRLLNDFNSGMIIGQDNAIIAVGFGQYVLEGKIDQDIKELTTKALRREMTPELINEFRNDYREIRIERLKKMLADVNKM